VDGALYVSEKPHFGQGPHIIGSPWDGIMTDSKIGGLHAGGIGEGEGPGYYDLKLGSEAAADAGEKGFRVGQDDEDIIQSSLPKLQSSDPKNHAPFSQILQSQSRFITSTKE